ncbi:unnamed protein product [Lathyrus oleraceus]|uniref:Oligosaccharyl transferase STT3 N-terminal domain-containing protein n=1 Tax=Pisum sativum TaxID=3888 RepID=A0A9D4YPM5_PEA|nr:hypothetical protein KIW84_010522 [Pisum sativum]
MSQLASVEIDDNPFEPWEIPVSLKDASSLQNFSANNANVKGKLPNFLGDDVFPVLTLLHLAFNNLEVVLPKSFSGLKVESLWLNGQKSDGKLTGSVEVLQNMTSLTEVWLHSNAFSGPLPSFEGLKDLEVLSLRDNSFTGVVPSSLVSLKSLKVVNLTNNLFQGPVPGFGAGIVATTLIAICPGYISRSVAGSYDNEGVAIFVLLLTFYLFVKAVNTGSLSWSLASAFGYFYMVSAWGGYVFIINLVPLYVLVLLVTGRYSLRLYVAYNCMYVLGMLLAMQIRFVGFQHVQSGEHMASMGVFFLLQMPYTFFQL